MEHPEPAFGLLTSLPMEKPTEEVVFVDWHDHEEIDAGVNDGIRSHPEIWNVLELPLVLQELSTDDIVSFLEFDGVLNLNAIAIGLGLSNVKYKPEVFSGLVYEPAEYDGTVLLFNRGVILGVTSETNESENIVHHAVEQIRKIGLATDVEFGAIETDSVSQWCR